MIITDKVFVFPNPTRDNALKALPEILDYLLSEGFTVYMQDIFRPLLADEYPIVSFLTTEEAIKASSFVLVIGGDGTILHISSFAAHYHKPVLGINLGTIGFLSELDMRDIEMLKRVKNGGYKLDERMLIDVAVKNAMEEITFSATGLNDAAIMKGDISKIIKLLIYVNGRKIMGFSGDGAVVCTPTGSTAYSLSAGGPILEPSSFCMAVTPVCPHSLAIKSFVVSADREIEIALPPQNNSVQLSVDGYQNKKLEPDERIIVKRSEKTLSLIRLKGIVFYERINQKLSNERL